MINSTLYIFAAGGQKNEGNIVFNGEIKSDVWNKTSNSIDYYTFNTTGLTKDNNTVFFQSTGSTILALHQILVVERENTQNIKLTVENLEKYYGGSEKLNATLKDGAGNPIANKTITFTINGQKYNRTTNSNGIASLAINLRPGVYDVTTMYDNMSVYSNVVVKTTIESKDLVKMYQNGTQFFATFLGTDGKPLANNTKVTFNINGVFYTRQTNENGVARLNINLRPGNYIITTIFEGLTIGNNINVLPTLVTSDLSMKYLDGSKFTAQTLDGQGNPLTNQNVSFNINGVLYQKVTDKEGIASLNITLLAGEYIITSYWNDFQVGNTIKID